MSQYLPSEQFAELLSGDMVGIQVGERTTYIHQEILDSVADAFIDVDIDIDGIFEDSMDIIGLPAWDIETFPRFVTWLYNNNRRHYMGVHKPKALIRLYCLGISLESETLRADALHHLLRIISLGGDSTVSFFQAADSMSVAAQTCDDNLYNISNFHILLDELFEGLRIDSQNLSTLLELSAKSTKWGNHNLQNRFMDSIRDKLDDKGHVFSFEYIKLIFDHTKESGAGNPLRKLAVALTYYQRCWVEGPIKTGQKLGAIDMVSRLRILEIETERWIPVTFIFMETESLVTPPWTPKKKNDWHRIESMDLLLGIGGLFGDRSKSVREAIDGHKLHQHNTLRI
ncbi:hypothetical protein N431DRAFT_440726 [Stipitochalara longipes BDJ]|nr:hypothetical protein N431DRAFT_440726 [Stipitochalara longipes BDJ]